MADVQTSEVDAKILTMKVGPWNLVCWQTLKWWRRFNNISFVKNTKILTLRAVEGYSSYFVLWR